MPASHAADAAGLAPPPAHPQADLPEPAGHAVALADWRAEREAGTRLGDVYAAAGEPAAAISYYIACGENEPLSKVAGQLPEKPFALPVPTNLADLPPWERAASCVIAGSTADLLPDSDAVSWPAAALDGFTQAEPVPSPVPLHNSRRCCGLRFGRMSWPRERSRFVFLRLALPGEGDRLDEASGGYGRVER